MWYGKKIIIIITFLKCQLILYLMRYFKMIIIIIEQSMGCSIPMWLRVPGNLKLHSQPVQ